jgi:1-acyl-sn-glycerol-3-phosphate acyltransferase
MKDKTIEPLVAFVKFTGFPVAIFYMRPKIYYMDQKKKHYKLPKPCIVMSNHTSLWDHPFYMRVFLFRTIHWLMGEVLFQKSKFFSWFLYSMGGIYVDREAHNFNCIRDALKLLEKGKTVGVFPQGRLPVNGVPFPFMPGIAMLATRTDAPIVPVYTDGNYGMFKRVHVIIGEEIYIKDYMKTKKPSGEEIRRLTKILEEKNNELKAELERRLAAEKK